MDVVHDVTHDRCIQIFSDPLQIFSDLVVMRVSPRRLCSSFPALVTRGPGSAAVETMSLEQLPARCEYKQTRGPCDMLVRVQYSTLNYKDALVVSGK